MRLMLVLFAVSLAACGREAPVVEVPDCLPACFKMSGQTDRYQCFSSCVAPSSRKVEVSQ
jgi:entry exclusion lipoprotein TrbK